MNITQTRKHVKKLYDKVEKIVFQEFTDILLLLEDEYYDIALDLGYDGDLEDLDESFIEEFFEEYNPVTKYVFKNELGRKESRLFESLIADAKDKVLSYQTAEKLLKRQIQQYAVDLEDKVAKTVYKALGVQQVLWVTEQDERTCGVCQEMDGTVHALDEVPPKPHYQCRCYLIPVRVKQ